MAQLNPNFEIDFNDINSYEQVQLINDTRLARENLLMHKAYKEPAEDEIIRNQFSSFTFVDFCPKLFNSQPRGTATTTTTTTTTSATDASTSSPSSSSHHQARHNQYLLETFSDLFDRINMWLRVNRDWRVISMETLVFDCVSQFNHLKSSFHSVNLPRNMRGLRLYLSPTKSRFSGPQKIGCINVIPRRISSPRNSESHPVEYETLDQILARLNELLLTRPIEGRILSVETITLPIVSGYVNTETNYFMDNRLNALSQRIYSHTNDTANRFDLLANPRAAPGETMDQTSRVGGLDADAEADEKQRRQTTEVGARDEGDHDGGQLRTNHGRPLHQNGLIDTLRVYYEFGPRVCGLVNLIDFLPRFNLRQTVTRSAMASPIPNESHEEAGPPCSQLSSQQDETDQTRRSCADFMPALFGQVDIESTESLTRLIGRSLNWFEGERKRIMAEGIELASVGGDGTDYATASSTSSSSDDSSDTDSTSSSSSPTRGGNSHQGAPADSTTTTKRLPVNLKLCNLQVHTRIMLKSKLAHVTPQTAMEVVQSRRMFHEPPREPATCRQCDISSLTHEPQEWCTHVLDLNQAFDLKFVRLAYVVPVCEEYINRFTRSLRSLPRLQTPQNTPEVPTETRGSESVSGGSSGQTMNGDVDKKSNGEISQEEESNNNNNNNHDRELQSPSSSSRTDDDDDDDDDDEVILAEEAPGSDGDPDKLVGGILGGRASAEKLAKEASLNVLARTNERHRRYEQLHQLHDEPLPDSSVGIGSSGSPEPGQLIGQLTYRLFAPCQLVNSSSCFSINPVNSSNPLARRGSVVTDGSACSENATPSTMLLPPTGGFMGDSPSGSTLTINTSRDQLSGPRQLPQQVISFGAFFPALAHDTILGYNSAHGGQKTGDHQTSKSGPSYRFATNEFEPVEAIRRRMEVYVTTNSMKVLAGETLVVNLGDHLSCLSNAIEQTISKASFCASRKPSTWVSVYILYAAIDEPHLPSQLLEQQKLRERLQLIDEVDEREPEPEPGQALSSSLVPADATKQQGAQSQNPHGDGGGGGGEQGEQNLVPVFDDDFKCEREAAVAQDQPDASLGEDTAAGQQQQVMVVSSTHASLNLENGSIRVELSRPLDRHADPPPYNTAYDRTVALPTQPDDHLTNYLEPVDLNLAGSWAQQQPQPYAVACSEAWLGENDLVEDHSYQLSDSSVRDASKLLRMRQQQQRQQLVDSKLLDGSDLGAALVKRRSRKGGKRKSRSRRSRQHSQCSLM